MTGECIIFLSGKCYYGLLADSFNVNRKYELLSLLFFLIEKRKSKRVKPTVLNLSECMTQSKGEIQSYIVELQTKETCMSCSGIFV